MSRELVFGRYEKLDRIGIGGMGEVFLAIQSGVSGFERRVILKSLRPEIAAGSDTSIDRFLDEARVAATLNHPNVVTIHEVGLWRDTYYIVMEYIAGENLAVLLERARAEAVEIRPELLARIVRDAALGLDHAHKALGPDGQPAGIVHRDVSPQNVMVRKDGVVKVVDFGVARARNRVSQTVTGTFRGKIAYASPEQVRGEALDARSDQFSLGVVLWELLTRRRLFRGEAPAETLHNVLMKRIAPPSAIVPGCPEALDAIVLRMLARDKRRRFLDLAEAAEELSAFLSPWSPLSLAQESAEMVCRCAGELIERRESSASSHGSGARRDDGSGAEGEIGAGTGGDSTRTENASTTPALRTSLASEDFGGATEPLSGGRIDRPADRAVAPRRRRAALAATAAASATVAAGVAALLLLGRAERVDPTAIPPPAPGAISASLLIVSTPEADAVVAGRAVGRTPIEVRDLSPSVPIEIRVEREGWRSVERTLTLEPGERRHLEIALGEAGVAPGDVEPAASSQPVPRAGRAKEPSHEPSARRSTKLRPSRAAHASAEPALLTLSTEPWSKVYVDGRYLGQTPLFREPIEPGARVLLLVNEAAGARLEHRITLAPGESRALKLDLPAGGSR